MIEGKFHNNRRLNRFEAHGNGFAARAGGNKMSTPFRDPAVKAAFDAHAKPMRSSLLRLRELVLASVSEHPRVGALIETLKWGEPAWLPAAPRVGTTVRINALRRSSTQYACYFHCKTTLIRTFRLLYPEIFLFEGDRAIVFSVGDSVAEEPFKHCVALALTYHLRHSPLTAPRAPGLTLDDATDLGEPLGQDPRHGGAFASKTIPRVCKP